MKNESPQRRRGRRELTFCLSGDDDKQKHPSNKSCKFLPNRRLPIGQMGFPQRTLRLCGEMSESLSARIGENLRLKLFAGLAQPKADPSSGGVLGDTHC